MTSRERVTAALQRQSPDRVPIFMWFHPGTTDRLAALLELPASLVADALGNDVRQTWVGNNFAMEGIIHEREGETHRDLWGIQWVRVGHFNQILSSPLSDAGRDDVLAYRFPHGHVNELLLPLVRLLETPDDAFIGADVSPCLFEMVCRLRGMEQAILDLAEDQDLASSLLSAAADFSVALAEAVCARGGIDWLWTGDDVAGQKSMIMSPAAWRSMVRPHLERIVRTGKRYGLPVAYHCCGALRPIIPDLVAMGIDVLNPIQCNCPGMDALELKREFGEHLTFMGGVDTVELLPNGEAREVYAATARLIEVMSAGGGGYILAASHTIPPETPLDNIFALYEAAGVSRAEIMDRAAGLRRQCAPSPRPA